MTHVPCNVKQVILETEYLDDNQAEAINHLLGFDGVNYVEPIRDSKRNSITFNVIVNTQLIKPNRYEDMEDEIKFLLINFNKYGKFNYQLVYK